jgi:hypothetical protein
VYTKSFALSLVEKGISAGYPFGGILRPGLEYMNINSYISHPSKFEPSSNLTSNIPVIIFNTSDNYFLNGQLQFHIAPPAVFFKKGGEEYSSWHGSTYNPLGLAGVAWKLPYGFSFSNAIGGFIPWQSGEPAYNGWTFVNAFGLSHYEENDHNFTTVLFVNIPGINYKEHAKTEPDSIALNVTATIERQHIEFGPIAYLSADFGSRIKQQQLAFGPLIGFHFKEFYIQFWWGHDAYQHHFSSQHSGGFVRFVLEFPNKK